MSNEPPYNEGPGITNDGKDFIVKWDFVLTGFHCENKELELTETETVKKN